MSKINLREYYPDYYKSDFFVEIPNEIAAVLREFKKLENAYQRRVYYNRAHYSLDRGDGIEYETVLICATPYEIYELNLRKEQLYAAIASLPDKQAKRINARFFLGLTSEEIANSEGVSVTAINDSIRRALKNIKIFLTEGCQNA